MPRHINLKGRGRRFNRRVNKKSFKESAPDPIETSRKEQSNEVRVNAIQQKDINKEISEMKRDVDRSDMNESMIKKKMMELISELPQESKLRKMMDEEKAKKNNGKSRSIPKIKS